MLDKIGETIRTMERTREILTPEQAADYLQVNRENRLPLHTRREAGGVQTRPRLSHFHAEPGAIAVGNAHPA